MKVPSFLIIGKTLLVGRVGQSYLTIQAELALGSNTSHSASS